MKRLQPLVWAAACVACTTESIAQQSEIFHQWTTEQGTQQFFQRSAVRTDDQNHVYVAGATLNSSGDHDILIAKYDEDGQLLWSDQVNGSGQGDDAAIDLWVDDAYNVYVTGFVYTSASDSNDVWTREYDDQGTAQWTQIYSGSNGLNDIPAAIVVENGEVFVTGTTQNDSIDTDILFIGYASGGGSNWDNQWDYSGFYDVGYRMLYDNGTLVIAGGAQSGGVNWDYAVLEVDASNGNVQSSTTNTGNAFGIDEVTDLQLWNDHYYVTGFVSNVNTGRDMRTLKLDSTLTTVWSHTYHSGEAHDDVAYGLAIDSVHSLIYVTGYAESSANGTDFLTIRYTDSGQVSWAVRFNDSTANGADTARAIAFHPLTNEVVVAGHAYNGDNTDLVLLKYDSSGQEVWQKRHNNVRNTGDFARALAVDNQHAIYLAAQCEGDNGLQNTVLKYTEATVWEPNDGESTSGSFDFVQNNGQLQNGVDIRFYNDQMPYSSYFSDSAISYVYWKADLDTATADSAHRVDVAFINPLTKRVHAYEPRTRYQNHYYTFIPEGRERVPLNEALYHKNLWSGVDLRVASNGAGMKYQYIVSSIGNPSAIKVRVTGADSVFTDGSGNLVISTRFGDITWPAPTAQERDANGTLTDVSWTPAYSVSEDFVSFTTGARTAGTQLVLTTAAAPPTIAQASGVCWSTYFGGNRLEFPAETELDKDGNQYITGTTFSDNSFPGASGIGTPPAVSNMFTSSFNVTHRLNWTTFFGGSGFEETYGLAITGDGSSVYVTGTVDGTVQMSASPFQDGYNDNTRVGTGSPLGFLVRMDDQGDIKWSTYLGDQLLNARDVAVNTANEVFVLCHVSTNDLPTPSSQPSGAYTNSYQGGFDFGLMQFSATDELVWSTYFGGSANDFSTALEIGSDNTIYVSGYTESTDFTTAGAGGGAFVTGTLSGAQDLTLTQFSAARALEWSTLFGGTGTETLYSFGFISLPRKNIAVSPDGNTLALVGHTNSGSGFPLLAHTAYTGAFYDNTYAADNGFLAEFNTQTHAQVWTTYLGGDATDLFGVALGESGRLFAGGFSNDASAVLSSSGSLYYQSALEGTGVSRSDGYLYTTTLDRKTNYATYFGGNETFQAGTGDRINEVDYYRDANGDEFLFITGVTETEDTDSPEHPLRDADPGSTLDYYQNLFGGGADAYIAKICINELTVGISDVSGSTADAVIMYPNPAYDYVRILSKEAGQPIRQVQVLDAAGRVLVTRTLNEQQMELDVSTLPRGMYLVKVTHGTENTIQKLSKL